MTGKRERIIVTQPEFDKGHKIFSNNDHFEFITCGADESTLANHIIQYQARFAIVGIKPYNNELYNALPVSGIIARFGVGHENIDKHLATSKNIYCTNTPGVLDDSVAEFTVALLMEISRKVGNINASLKLGEWRRVSGLELKGKTITIIGCGQIGRKVAGILHDGFGMKVLGYDKREMSDDNHSDLKSFDKVLSNLEEALSDVDFMSVHITGDKDNRHFINDQTLKILPKRAWIINTSRGAVLDEAALFKAIKSGSIAGAALDVYEHEPYKPVSENSDLRIFPNVIMTSHVGSSTQEANVRMAAACLKNIKLAISGEYQKMDLINSEIVNKLK